MKRKNVGKRLWMLAGAAILLAGALTGCGRLPLSPPSVKDAVRSAIYSAVGGKEESVAEETEPVTKKAVEKETAAETESVTTKAAEKGTTAENESVTEKTATGESAAEESVTDQGGSTTGTGGTAAGTGTGGSAEETGTDDSAAETEAGSNTDPSGQAIPEGYVDPSTVGNDLIFGTWSVITSDWSEESAMEYAGGQWSPYLIFCHDGRMAYSFGDMLIEGTFVINPSAEGEVPLAIGYLDDGRVCEISIYHMVMDVTNMDPIVMDIGGRMFETTTWGFEKWSDSEEYGIDPWLEG